MQMYLQFGHGMMSIAEELLGKWKNGGVILSPRDLDEGQLERMAGVARSFECEALLDPQCYIHASDHQRLTSHPYWQAFRSNTTEQLTESANSATLELLIDLNHKIGSSAVILPGLFAEALTEEWWGFHEAQLGDALERYHRYKLIPTIAISSELVRDEAAVEQICERTKGWLPKRFYLVVESTSSYLSDDPLWLAGVLTLVGGFKLNDKQTIVGYTNHQLLGLSCVRADIVASGTWLNVRAFPPEKFRAAQEDEISRRAKGGWYYLPQALSEYKMPFLDVAQRRGVLESMAPLPNTGYSAALLSGVQPTLVNWGGRETHSVTT